MLCLSNVGQAGKKDNCIIKRIQFLTCHGLMILIVLFVAGCLLAYSNGANDNFKGVATLFGSGTTNYKKAITWATITTALGSVAAIFLASSLVKNFSGKGLVPDALIQTPEFAISIALGAESLFY